MPNNNSSVHPSGVMHEGGKPEKPTDKVEPVKSPEQIAEEKEKLDLASKKAKEILFSYVRKHRCLMILGFILSIFGMVGEFISPLYIGWVIDAITNSDMPAVKNLILWWMIFNTSGAIFAGLQSFTFQLTT